MVITSAVKEINGYIEIVANCEEYYLNRESLIKKDQITCVNIFYNPMGFRYCYAVWIESDSVKNRYDFERKEDAEQLYNALSKLLKKKDIKSSASKKTV
jgi:hypothetical protein